MKYLANKNPIYGVTVAKKNIATPVQLPKCATLGKIALKSGRQLSPDEIFGTLKGWKSLQYGFLQPTGVMVYGWGFKE